MNTIFISSFFILQTYTRVIKRDTQSEPHHVIKWSYTADELRSMTSEKIEEEKKIIEQVVNVPDLKCTFDNIVAPLIRKVENEMTYFSYYLYLLENVAPEKEIRQVSAECFSEIDEFNYNNVWTNKDIYDKILRVKRNIYTFRAKQLRSDEDKRLLDNLINEFRVSGLDLSDEESEKLNDLDMKIADLEYAFTDCIYEGKLLIYINFFLLKYIYIYYMYINCNNFYFYNIKMKLPFHLLKKN